MNIPARVAVIGNVPDVQFSGDPAEAKLVFHKHTVDFQHGFHLGWRAGNQNYSIIQYSLALSLCQQLFWSSIRRNEHSPKSIAWAAARPTKSPLIDIPLSREGFHSQFSAILGCHRTLQCF